MDSKLLLFCPLIARVTKYKLTRSFSHLNFLNFYRFLRFQMTDGFASNERSVLYDPKWICIFFCFSFYNIRKKSLGENSTSLM